MTTYFNHVNIEIASYTDIKQPDFDSAKAFYCIYSPKSFMLRPSVSTNNTSQGNNKDFQYAE